MLILLKEKRRTVKRFQSYFGSNERSDLGPISNKLKLRFSLLRATGRIRISSRDNLQVFGIRSTPDRVPSKCREHLLTTPCFLLFSPWQLFSWSSVARVWKVFLFHSWKSVANYQCFQYWIARVFCNIIVDILTEIIYCGNSCFLFWNENKTRRMMYWTHDKLWNRNQCSVKCSNNFTGIYKLFFDT